MSAGPIVAGVGFRAACTAEEIAALVRQVASAAGVEVGRLAAPDFKAEAPALRRAAEMLGLELVLAPHARLAEVQPLCLSRSRAAEAATDLASVAEACALAAAGPGARLLGPRTSNGVATCALAQGEGA
jgi:cobalt-precorrin 5A hydrolase